MKPLQTYRYPATIAIIIQLAFDDNTRDNGTAGYSNISQLLAAVIATTQNNSNNNNVPHAVLNIYAVSSG